MAPFACWIRTADRLRCASLNGQTGNTHLRPSFHTCGLPSSGQKREIQESRSNSDTSLGKEVVSTTGGASFHDAAVSICSGVTMPVFSGTERICAMRCGRVLTSSPLQFMVPGILQIRAGLNTVRSTSTLSSPAVAIPAMHRWTSPPSSTGRSIRYIICAPLPESSRIGSGQPEAASPDLILQAIEMAASCSASELDTPDTRFGSQSTRSQRRATMSVSAVVASRVMPRSRLQARANRSGLTGLTVAYAPR